MSKIKWVKFLTAMVIVTALLAGCGGAALQQAAVTVVPADATLDAALAALAPAGPVLARQRAGDVLGWLSSEPAQPRRGAAALDVYLVDVDGQPITDAAVTFDTDMTNMSHGPYLVEAQGVGGGRYVGQVHFSMPGPWRVIAVVARPGRETARLRFEFAVKR